MDRDNVQAMTSDDERCAEAAQLQRIDAAFQAGDLEALRAAVDDPSAIPNGQMPITVGSCLVYAIYCSPPAFIRTLLEIGADPNAPVDDGFPPLIAALSCSRDVLDAKPRRDVGNRADIVAILERKGQPERRRLRSGLTLLLDVPGNGPAVLRQRNYLVRLRLWLHRGDPVRWQMASGPVGVGQLEDNGETLVTEMRIDRHSLANGLFYGIDGMRVGGTRRLEIAPHLAYGERGVPGMIPENALIVAEVTILSEGRSPSA